MPHPDPAKTDSTKRSAEQKAAASPETGKALGEVPKDLEERANKSNREPTPEVEPPTVDVQGADSDGEAKPAETSLSETRFARLRKKKDMPGGLWLKCESCGQMIYRKELEEKGRVCPACDFHFTLPGRERIAMLLDPDSWKEFFADLHTIDRLKFHDQIPYLEKVKKAESRTGQAEALLCGTGAIEGRIIVLAVLDFSFLGGSMGEVVGEKIALAAELAGAKKLPLVIFTSSGGARMHEGVLSLMQMAKTCSALAEYNDKGGFSICVMTHPTTGGAPGGELPAVPPSMSASSAIERVFKGPPGRNGLERSNTSRIATCAWVSRADRGRSRASGRASGATHCAARSNRAALC